MRNRILQVLLCASVQLVQWVNVVHGHGVMYYPPTRQAQGATLLGPGCASGSCLWFNQGCTIGCPEATGGGTVFPDVPDCANPAEPVIDHQDHRLRTITTIPQIDWTKHKPWRKPGSAPVEAPCGLAGGWYTPGVPGNGGEPPPGVPQGALGTNLKPLFKETVWTAGSIVEVGWGVYANHGGGYSYRLCPLDNPGGLTEECFQKHHLQFVGDKQWLQYGQGFDTNNRTEINAVRISEGTVPEGSSWTRNPIPACAGIQNAISLGAFNYECDIPQFEPPAEGTFGFGGGACGSALPGTYCEPARFLEQSFEFGIVDQLQLPDDLPEGKYVIGFRWDVEQTPQIWTTCSDVTISRSREPTRPFEKYEGCEACCGSIADGGVCGNCTVCLDDRTGPCEYCWKELPGYNPRMAPPSHCLGFDAPDGGPTEWNVGDPMIEGASRGCTKCWREDACSKHMKKKA